MEISQATNYPKRQSIFALLASLQVVKEITEMTDLQQIRNIILRYMNCTVADLLPTAQEFQKVACHVYTL